MFQNFKTLNVRSSLQIKGPAADMSPNVVARRIFIYLFQTNKNNKIGIETKPYNKRVDF